ncbi:hypothetical protein D3C78_1561590 [compost metagenome]
MLQYNQLTSAGSGGTTIFTAVRSSSGAAAKVRQAQSPIRTTFSPRLRRACSAALKPPSSTAASSMRSGANSLSICAASAGHCSLGTARNCLTIKVCRPRE